MAAAIGGVLATILGNPFGNFVLMTCGMQLGGALGNAIATTSTAEKNAKSQCDILSGLNEAVAQMQDNITSLSLSTAKLDTVKQQIQALVDKTFVSDAAVALQKRQFAIKLAIAIIVAILTTLVAVFIIMHRSDALAVQLKKLGAK